MNFHQVSGAGRISAAVALLALGAAANADLKLKVTVSASGATASVLPKSGVYELDFRRGSARVVLPSGQIQLYDFGTGKVSQLDPKAKTYTTYAAADLQQPAGVTPVTAGFQQNRSAQPRTVFGASASRYGITVPSNAPQPASGRRMRFAGTQAKTIGSAWVVDSSAVRTSLTSIAPLIAIGAPIPLVQSIAQQMDGAGFVPVDLEFSWVDGTAQDSVTMHITSVETPTLDASLYAVPTEYKPAPKTASQ